MSIRIISSRKLRFFSPDRKESIVVEGKNIISSVPDWAVNDAMFKAARSAGLIQILSTAKELKRAENNPENVVPQNAHEATKKMEKDNSSEEVEEAEEDIPEDDQDDENSAEAKEAAKKAARKAARAARKAKKAE